MIPAGFIQDLIARADVVEVVGRHVELKKAGINFKGLCPFHGEKTPSFIVSPSRQTYHCFGCQRHGDALRFLIEHTGAGFVDAVHDLAQQVGMTVPQDEVAPEERMRLARQRERAESLSGVLEKATGHYRQQLKAAPRAIDYLKRRGLSGAVAARFGLGYAPDGWRSLASVFPRYDDELLVEAGLVIVQGENPEQQSRYDRFRDRIMFPIRDVKGGVIGFGGRVLDQGEPKYLNSPETPLFVKGRELYGLYEARQGLREKGYALVTEGYMDVVALAQLGFPNAVATLGTACTADHVQKLLRFTDQVVFSFDGDAAGRKAAARALEAALPHAQDTRSFRFLFLPAEHDPDSFIRAEGPAAFERCVAAAVPLSRQLLEQAARDCDLDSAEGRARMLAQARPLLDQLPAGLLREQVLSDLAERGRVPAATLSAHWAQTAAQNAARTAAQSSARPAGSAAESASARRRPARALPVTGKRLERAARIVLHHADLWLTLSHEAHDTLSRQPSPYGEFFALVDRIVHAHGALPAAAMRHELQAAVAAEPPPLTEFLRRLEDLHDIGDEEQPREQMDAVLHYLDEAAVDDELNLLAESGELSEAAQARRRQLYDRQRELKLSRPS